MKALWKDFFREILKSLNRFISILAIIFIGVAFFAGVKATAPDMKHSMDLYYDEYNLMDIRVLSTLGLTPEDIRAISRSDGVLEVQSGYFTDVVTTIDATEYVVKVHSIPTERMSQIDNINRFKITAGRYPQRAGECLIEDSLNLDVGLEIGEKFRVSSGKAEAITEKTLAADEFIIVGKAITPYYLSYEKGTSELGRGKIDFFMMILEEDFSLPVYTEALVTVKGAKALNSYNKDYEKLVTKAVTPLENLGTDRSVIRLAEIKDIALRELAAATEQFNAEKEKFDQEIKKGEEDLSQGQADLVEGETKLATERKNFAANYQQAAAQIADGEKQLADAEIAYAEALTAYNKAMEENGEDLEQLNSITGQLNSQRASADQNLAELYQQLDDPNLTPENRESTESLIGFYEEFLNISDEGLGSINGLNDFAQNQVKNAQTQLNNARKELDTQTAALAKAKKDLSASKVQANAKFAAAERQLAAARREYEQGKAELAKAKIEGQQKLDEGREKIIRAENEIEKLSKPQWYVLDRNAHYSYVDYGQTADRIDAIAKIFPVFFFLVASLVCLTTMTRMVDEQRGAIGIYKALGYSNKDITAKYVLYAGVASLIGGIAGLCLGMRVFPEVIYRSWSMMYTLPELQTVPQLPLMIISLLTGMLVTTLTAVQACKRELKEVPASLMRPKAPAMGKQIFLERVQCFWQRLSFSQKVTVRNLFRYKKRFYMTIIGITGCCALLLAGFGLSDSISQVVKKQYQEIFRYDLNVTYTATSTPAEQQSIINLLKKDANVDSYILCTRSNAKVKSTQEDIAATLIIPSDTDKLSNYITLRHRHNQDPIEIPDKGVIINEKLAKELDVRIGDAIELDNGDGARKKVEIAAITENYVFHYAYMSPAYYQEIFRLEPKVNNLMIKLSETSSAIENDLGSTLIKSESVASVEFYTAVAATFEDTVNILNSIVIVIIISAGLLAFVVLYNLTNINISERIREIATIKVLGFYNNEVASYVYRENIVLALIGSVVGLLVGVVLHRFIMISLEQNGIMFGNHLELVSFFYAALLTLGFVMLVNLFMNRRLKNIPMVESLKSVE